ncbi:hypothetical protein EJ04DRAFT_509642, partial [Polyplosphaeria fusca]
MAQAVDCHAPFLLGALFWIEGNTATTLTIASDQLFLFLPPAAQLLSLPLQRRSARLTRQPVLKGSCIKIVDIGGHDVSTSNA